jgi:hypothetical protein
MNNKQTKYNQVITSIMPPKEKRDRVIRIRTYNYERLSRLGTIADDFDDALTRLLDYWEKNTAGVKERK